MTTQAARSAYEELTDNLATEEGVTVADEGLLVHGKLFAFLENDNLVVELPLARAEDLEARGVAAKFHSDTHPATRHWVQLSDRELWPELAGEAHEYVGEPAFGGQS
ncbi:hypothetical protein [Glaciihabitans sp. dw_435]|uniref:hypothetical protein n=1 Tax=Glaciihabitans sp. dw_435 TaxID=2720081 RepID=UPI001BD48A2A|nr:hypothetical protein [Glaciihabitans sp. dw_435]